MPVVINGSTGISGTDGSNTTPAFQGTDTNTGITFPAADTIAFVEGGVEAMRIDSSSNIGIGISPTYKLDVSGGSGTSIVSRGWSATNTQSSQMHFMAINNGGTGDTNMAGYTFHCSGTYATHMHLRADGFLGVGGWSASAWRWYVNMGNGDMIAAGNVTAYSDPRLKEDVEAIQSPIEKLQCLDGVRFKWKQNSIVGHPGTYDYGVLADQVQKVFPEIVSDTAHDSPDGDKYKAVAYDKLVPVLIEAVKVLSAKVEALESKEK